MIVAVFPRIEGTPMTSTEIPKEESPQPKIYYSASHSYTHAK
jgi:hypothetical protein